jgi:hypothetical protein
VKSIQQNAVCLHQGDYVFHQCKGKEWEKASHRDTTVTCISLTRKANNNPPHFLPSALPAKKATTSRGKQKAAATTDEEDMLLLNCLIRGQNSTFGILVYQNALVRDLKVSVYEKRAEHVFHDFVPEDLDLYQVCHVQFNVVKPLITRLTD